MSLHTPGPMTVSETAAGYGIYRADGWPIAVAMQRDAHPVRGGEVTDAESLANATLFACAPDLLDLARRYAYECAECGGAGTRWTSPQDPQDSTEYPCQDCADIRAIIAKAEGRE